MASFPEIPTKVPLHRHTFAGRHVMSRSADVSELSTFAVQQHQHLQQDGKAPRVRSHSGTQSGSARPPTPPSPTPIQPSVTNNVSFPALSGTAHSNGGTRAHPQRAPKRRSPPKAPPKRNLPHLKAAKNAESHSLPPRDLAPLQLNTVNAASFLTTSPDSGMAAAAADGAASPTSPHRMSVSEHRRLHQSTNSFSSTIKLGPHQPSQSKKVRSPYGEEPSLRDSKWLRDELKGRNAKGDYSAVLLQVWRCTMTMEGHSLSVAG